MNVQNTDAKRSHVKLASTSQAAKSTSVMNVNGYPAEMRLQAIKLYLKGNSFRNIEHLLKISHQSVANWSKLIQSNYQKLNFLKAPSGRTGQVLYLYW